MKTDRHQGIFGDKELLPKRENLTNRASKNDSVIQCFRMWMSCLQCDFVGSHGQITRDRL